MTFALIACFNQGCPTNEGFTLMINRTIVRAASAVRTCHPITNQIQSGRDFCLSLTAFAGPPAPSSTTASGLSLGPTIGISVGVVLLGVAIGSVVLICRRKEANLCFKKTTPQPLPHIGTINTTNPVALAVDYK